MAYIILTQEGINQPQLIGSVAKVSTAHAQIARHGVKDNDDTLFATPSTLQVFGHAFERDTGNDSTLLYAAPGVNVMTTIQRKTIRADIIKMSNDGAPQIAIGVLQLATLYFEEVSEGREPFLTVWNLKGATKTDRGYEIRDIVIDGRVVMLIVTGQYDQLETFNAEGRPLTQPDVI